MFTRIRIYRSGILLKETPGVTGETILRSINAAGIFPDAPCGGVGKCGKCLVRLNSDGEQILACRTMVEGDTDVYLPDEKEMIITFGESVPYDDNEDAHIHQGLGAAIDIGTTTVVVHLIEIGTGARIASASGINAQRSCGADVMSRIQYCIDYGHEVLTQLIREQLALLIRYTCSVSGVLPEDIGRLSIAGNALMEHLAAGFSPVSMGTAPFSPVSLFGFEISAWESLPVAKSARVYFMPAISSFVGGDVTAGLLAAGFMSVKKPAIYLDIGTNGEIVLKSGNTYYCCATAAGPAFEGAEIVMGMAAVSGAVAHVRWDDRLIVSVIGDCEPCGICGSGLIDVLAILLETGAVDETGRLLDTNEIDHKIAANINIVDGKKVLRLTGNSSGVFITETDIRKLQLAKAAIAAGIQTLLNHTGIKEENVKTFVLAGGFGSFLDMFNAVRIGLFPRKFLDVAQALGNTAGEGASIALCSKTVHTTLEGIRKRCKYIDLSVNPVFNEQFVEQMMFKTYYPNEQSNSNDST